MHRSLVILGLALAACAPLARPAMGESKLDQIRSEVRTPPPADEPEPAREHKDASGEGCCHDGDDDEDSLLGELLAPLVGPVVVGSVYCGAVAITSPFWGPPALLQDCYCQDASFPSFPYEERREGYLLIPAPGDGPAKCWAGQLALDAGTDFDDLTRFHARTLIELGPSRLGIDSQTSYWREDTGLGSDHLWLGDFNLVFRFAQSNRLAMRTGLGINWLADRVGDDTGLNFTYGGDWFPMNPLVVSACVDLGTLGHAWLAHAQATVGVQWHGVEVYGGYDFLSIDSADNQFFLAGLRLWF